MVAHKSGQITKIHKRMDNLKGKTLKEISRREEDFQKEVKIHGFLQDRIEDLLLDNPHSARSPAPRSARERQVLHKQMASLELRKELTDTYFEQSFANFQNQVIQLSILASDAIDHSDILALLKETPQ